MSKRGDNLRAMREVNVLAQRCLDIYYAECVSVFLKFSVRNPRSRSCKKYTFGDFDSESMRQRLWKQDETYTLHRMTRLALEVLNDNRIVLTRNDKTTHGKLSNRYDSLLREKCAEESGRIFNEGEV